MTSKSRKLEKLVLNCMHSLTKISFVLTCFFGAVLRAVSWAAPHFASNTTSVAQSSLCHPWTAARQAFLSVTNSKLAQTHVHPVDDKTTLPLCTFLKHPECGLHLQVGAYVVPCGKIPWYCELFTLSGAYPISQSEVAQTGSTLQPHEP